jgi:aspartate/tyrosine/aromatic aminotransferase
MNVGIGAYRDDSGKPYVLKVVREAERRIQADAKLNHEYLPQEGLAEFRKAAATLLFGANSDAMRKNRVATVQSLSGTGALRVGSTFVHKYFPNAHFYCSDPTWGNHFTVFREAGCTTHKYRYWDEKSRALNIDGMLSDIRAAPTGSVIVLHACAHNPTGVDPTREQWKQILQVVKERGHMPFFDSAYQGFATGDLENDAYSIRLFADAGLDMMVCQSFAKNAGLYNERVGTFNVVTQSAEAADRVLSRIKQVIRPMYSNPPVHGARIIATILGDRGLTQAWYGEMKEMSSRIISMRHALVGALKKLGTPGDWSHITSQIGMFSFTGLTVAQSTKMIEKHHVYMLKNGRISMSGINTGNVEYLAAAMDDVVRHF